MDNHVVIMAGGIGSRFWPMSTPECPKQFIDVMGCGRSLIQLTADRFDGVCPRENMWVVTSEKYIDIVREQLPEIPESNILAEPCARNTAPCIAFACWKIKKKHPNANIVVTPSDALVIDTGEFRRVMEKALRFTDDRTCARRACRSFSSPPRRTCRAGCAGCGWARRTISSSRLTFWSCSCEWKRCSRGRTSIRRGSGIAISPSMRRATRSRKAEHRFY